MSVYPIDYCTVISTCPDDREVGVVCSPGSGACVSHSKEVGLRGRDFDESSSAKVSRDSCSAFVYNLLGNGEHERRQFDRCSGKNPLATLLTAGALVPVPILCSTKPRRRFLTDSSNTYSLLECRDGDRSCFRTSSWYCMSPGLAGHRAEASL